MSQEEEKDDLIISQDHKDQDTGPVNSSDDAEDDSDGTIWTKVQNNRRKEHIELKDLTEENFLQLTESKS